MPEECEAPENHLLHMGSHQQVCVDENTQITHRLNWVDRGAVDEQWRPGQLVLASRRHTPQNFSFVRIKLSLFNCIQLATAQEQAVSLAENASTLEAGHEP